MRTKIGAPPLGPNEIHARTQSGEMRCRCCRSNTLSRVNDVQWNGLGLHNVDFFGHVLFIYLFLDKLNYLKNVG
jgi:hypothetical protein